MSIQYTTEGVLMLPGGVSGNTAKVRWINGEGTIKLHQGSATIELTVSQFVMLARNADDVSRAASKVPTK